MRDLNRRGVIGLVGGAAAWPLAARAQQSAMPAIGFLNFQSIETIGDLLRAFRQGLKDTGYVEGENVAIIYRFAENQIGRLPELAADLVHRRVAVIATSGGPPSAFAAKAATTEIPVVFAIPEDPTKLGLVANLARPGGNLTGVNFFFGELVSKRLELLRELVPAMNRVAVFVNPKNPARAEVQAREADSAGRTLGLRVQVHHPGTVPEINMAFTMLARERPDALLITPDPFFLVRRAQLVTLAARHAIPTSFSGRDFVEAGGLMGYGPNINDAFHQAGVYTGRVLKGAMPADLPVLQSTRFELIINAQTALMLGLEIPPTLLARADEVIE